MLELKAEHEFDHDSHVARWTKICTEMLELKMKQTKK